MSTRRRLLAAKLQTQAAQLSDKSGVINQAVFDRVTHTMFQLRANNPFTDDKRELLRETLQRAANDDATVSVGENGQLFLYGSFDAARLFRLFLYDEPDHPLSLESIKEETNGSE